MIGIIDCGYGNTGSLESAYAVLGISTTRIIKVSQLSEQTHVILPGVGSFDDTMSRYNRNGFSAKLVQLANEKKIKILGICVGLQVLCLGSEEGDLPGLGLVNARVKKLHTPQKDTELILPHMGWNTLCQQQNHPLLNDISFLDQAFYFLHSYFVCLNDARDLVASCTYGVDIPSVIARDNLFGTQFHPEKSHSDGLKLLENFARL